MILRLYHLIEEGLSIKARIALKCLLRFGIHNQTLQIDLVLQIVFSFVGFRFVFLNMHKQE
jgi:hypothetical protein